MTHDAEMRWQLIRLMQKLQALSKAIQNVEGQNPGFSAGWRSGTNTAIAAISCWLKGDPEPTVISETYNLLCTCEQSPDGCLCNECNACLRRAELANLWRVPIGSRVHVAESTAYRLGVEHRAQRRCSCGAPIPSDRAEGVCVVCALTPPVGGLHPESRCGCGCLLEDHHARDGKCQVCTCDAYHGPR